jgi:4-hydroxy-2-oxoglutarate aldolase
MMRSLTGIHGPVVTPFDATTEDVVVDRFTANIRAHLDAGLDGILVAGSTGEAALLEESERRLLLEAARAVIPPDRVLLAGIGGESSRITIRRARDAKAAGADAVLVVSPHYYTSSMTSAALRDHFVRVADESPLPVLLYNIPKYAHFALSPELVQELSRHANIAGMKDSAGDLAMLEQYVQSQRDDFAVLTGNGPTFAAALALGVTGGILAVALYAPAQSREVYDAAMRDDAEGARAAQARMADAARIIVGELGVPGVKAALDEVGLQGGIPRSPLRALDASARARVAELVTGLSRSEPSGRARGAGASVA